MVEPAKTIQLTANGHTRTFCVLNAISGLIHCTPIGERLTLELEPVPEDYRQRDATAIERRFGELGDKPLNEVEW